MILIGCVQVYIGAGIGYLVGCRGKFKEINTRVLSRGNCPLAKVTTGPLQLG